jgi:hypothetical protein
MQILLNFISYEHQTFIITEKRSLVERSLSRQLAGRGPVSQELTSGSHFCSARIGSIVSSHVQRFRYKHPITKCKAKYKITTERNVGGLAFGVSSFQSSRWDFSKTKIKVNLIYFANFGLQIQFKDKFYL